MPTLRIRHHKRSGDCFVDLLFSGSVVLNASHLFSPELDRFDLEDLRWYQENYLESWYVSSNSVVARIKRAELKIGKAIHHALFDQAGQMAEAVRDSLAKLRIEICDEVHEAAVPWETITDEKTGERFALRSRSFVRSVGGAGTAEYLEITRAVHRLLLVICRPHGMRDIGYWSVAYSLWGRLREKIGVEIDVLRPATFDSLEKYLAEAKRAGRPYTAVHFDGHGVIVDPFGGSSARGYLVFESADRSNREFIDGISIGRVLAANDVPHLSMNACRSADSQSGDRHLRAAPELSTGQPSIVEEVLGEGVSSCIGMRREIYPPSAARFFGAFYPEFFGGRCAGDSVKIARSLLAGDPLRADPSDTTIAPIEDWSIPVVGERRPVRLGLEQVADGGTAPNEGVAHIPASLSRPCIVGFDREILTLETLFSYRKAVLICGPVLIGKSRLAVEFAKWYSATSVERCPIFYIRLSLTCDAASVLGAFGRCIGHRVTTISECADHLRSSGGVVVLDQADRLLKDTSAVLAELLNEIGAACKIIITSRTRDLDWLPDHSTFRPWALQQATRVELAQRWAGETGSPFELADYYPLLFFSGGMPGVLLLLVSSSYDLISRGAASAKEISRWLHVSEWHEITRLSPHPWPNLPSIEELVSDLVADIEATCDRKTMAMLSLLSRFHVGIELVSAARLVREAQGSSASDVLDEHTLESLESVGLLSQSGLLPEPTWCLHPLFRLVVSRLPGATKSETAGLDQVFVEIIAGLCADLIREYRHDVCVVVEKLASFEQNIIGALEIAIRANRTDKAATLVTAAGLLYRHSGNIEKMSWIFNYALFHFVDWQGAVRSNCRDIAMPLWDLAVWLAPDWPRNRGMRPPVLLVPPKEDLYAIGLWHRANNRYREAAAAFQRELGVRSSAGRYEPGDLQYQISEMIYEPSNPETWMAALEYARKSFDARRPNDAIGRAASRIAEARVRLVQILNQGKYRVRDLASRIDILPEDLRQLDLVANLLREAETEPGGMSAENRSQVAMIWSRIVLARGDLTSAVAYFEEGANLMIKMQEISIWHHYHIFSLQLLSHGWVAKSYEAAQGAYQFARYSRDPHLPTRLRQFCERLAATYPELERAGE